MIQLSCKARTTTKNIHERCGVDPLQFDPDQLEREERFVAQSAAKFITFQFEPLL